MLRTVLVALLGGIAASIGATLGDLAREAIENRLDPMPERRRRRRAQRRSRK